MYHSSPAGGAVVVKEKWLLKGVNVQTAGRNNWKMFLYFHALNPSDVWFLFDVIKSVFFFYV